MIPLVADLLTLPLRAWLFVRTQFGPGTGSGSAATSSNNGDDGRVERWIWNITREPADAERYFGLIYRMNQLRGRRAAAEALSEAADGRLFATLCALDLRLTHQRETARSWRASAPGECKNAHMLRYVDLILCEEPDEAARIAEEIASRGDYPPEITVQALWYVANDHVRGKRWADALEVIDRVLYVSEQRVFRILRLACVYGSGSGDPARELRLLKTATPDAEPLGDASARLLVGQREAARKALSRCSLDTLRNVGGGSPELQNLAREAMAERGRRSDE